MSFLSSDEITGENSTALDRLQSYYFNNPALSTGLNESGNRRQPLSNCVDTNISSKNNRSRSNSLHLVAEISNSELGLLDSESSLTSQEDSNSIYVSAHGQETSFFDSISISQNSEGYRANYFSLNCCNSGLQLGDYSPIPCAHNDDAGYSLESDTPVMAPFHQGGGRRGGVRLSTSIQDLELLLKSSREVENSPLHSRSSSRKVEHASRNTSPHILSLTSNSKPYLYLLPDNEFDPIMTSKNHLAGHHSDISSEVVVQPPPDHNTTCIKETKDLLHVLLSISEKYDFSNLKVRMLCNSEELNPNAEENAPFCQDFMESGICSKEQAGERCVFRHIKADHIECVVKKIRDGELPICLIRLQDSQYIVADLPCLNESPGEMNPHALPNADVCVEFSLRGVCPNDQLFRCHNRHLIDCHPERIAMLYRNGQITEFEASAWSLSPCFYNNINPFASSSDQLCKDFVNTGICNRNQEGRVCRFRHCIPDHGSL